MPLTISNTNNLGNFSVIGNSNKNFILSTPVVVVSVTDQIRSYITASLTSYDAAAVGSWVKVTSTEYNNVATKVTGATKKGNNDTQINNRDSLSGYTGYWITFGSAGTPTFQINNGEYVIAMITEAWNQSGGTSQLGYTTAFTGSSITNIGGTAGPSTGGGRDYFVRKAPTDAATETRYPVLSMTVSPNAVNTWAGYRSTNTNPSPPGAWISLPTNQVSKIQIVTTSTKSW